MRRVFALTLALLLAGCSATRSVYQRPGYPLGSEPAVKHIAVKAWAPAEPAVLAPVLAQVAADFVSLHKDYLVHAVEPMSRSWGDGCGDREAVLFVQLLRLARDGDTVDLDLAVELSRCSDGALLWRAEGSRKANANNEDLAELASSYGQKLGEEAKRYAAPAFALLQDLLQTLPTPQLSDEEVMQKIELEAATAP